MNNKIFALLILLVSACGLNGQSKKAFISAAETAMAENNFYGALAYYNEALQFDKNDQDLLFKTAEAARKVNAYGFAAKKYEYLIDTLKNVTNADAACRLGEMYQKLGDYDKAIEYFTLYVSEYSNANPELTTLARRGIISSNKAKELIKKQDTNVTVTRMSDDINSPDADFAASDFGGNMYFSSLKYDAKSKDLRYKQIAKTLIKKQGSMLPELLSGNMNERDQSVANFAFNSNGKKVYYSICDYVDGFSTRCELFSSDVDANGNLSNEQKLPSSINDGISSNTQPSVGKDKISGKEYLYFVSDRKGGLGGRDIWSSMIDGNNYLASTNVKAANTDQDEISPFYHQATNTLYFSSEGREGFGGLDIFSLTTGSNVPMLMPAPYNTSMNDMFFWMDANGTKGYLTSNRSAQGVQFDSYEACCMDIYSVDVKDEILLDVTTFLKTDHSNLNATSVCLLDADTGEELECILNPTNGNQHTFKLKPNRKYTLVATKDGFATDTQTFSTLPTDKMISKKLYLQPPGLKLEVFTFENPNKALLPGTTVTLVDLSDNTSKQVVVTNSKGNDFVFDVKPGKSYKLIAVKDGYTVATETINTQGASGTIRKDMYLQKEVLQDLLPISLYFDNDYPNPRSNSTQTTSNYVSLANDYLNKKSEYITQFTKPLSGENKIQAAAEIETFFRDDVQKGKDKFIQFLTQLEKRLAAGEKIELEVRGFASPRAKSDYNKILSERRINSIKNEMKLFGGQVIKQHLDAGSLKLKDVSYGNELAKPNVVGDLKDTRNSIYNLDAARERRVEILKVNYN